MDLTEQQKKGQEILFRIISEAWENDAFKQALLESPEETLDHLFGKKFLTPKPIKVTDQSDPTYIYINIPVKPQSKHQASGKKKSDTAACGKGEFVITDYETLYDLLGRFNK